MSISTVGASSIMGGNTGVNSSQPSAAEAAATDASFQQLLGSSDDDSADQAKQMLADITQGGATGYWAWQVQQMKQQAATQVMGSMDLTPAKIAAMDTSDRVAVEQKIEQLVEQKVKQEIAADSQQKQQQTLASSASMHSIITSAQSINPTTGAADPSKTQATGAPSDPLDMLFFGS
jgi:hypothetical protein